MKPMDVSQNIRSLISPEAGCRRWGAGGPIRLGPWKNRGRCPARSLQRLLHRNSAMMGCWAGRGDSALRHLNCMRDAEKLGSGKLAEGMSAELTYCHPPQSFEK